MKFMIELMSTPSNLTSADIFLNFPWLMVGRSLVYDLFLMILRLCAFSSIRDVMPRVLFNWALYCDILSFTSRYCSYILSREFTFDMLDSNSLLMFSLKLNMGDITRR